MTESQPSATRREPDPGTELSTNPTQIPANPETSEFHLWKVLFEQTPEAVAVLTSEDRVVRINKEFTRLFGYEPDEVVNQTINDLIVPDAMEESAEAYTQLLKQGSRVETETVRRRKDGSEVHVSLLAVPVTTASGEQLMNYAIYRDITERKRAEAQLRESEARFQTMADTAPVMIWTTGTDGLCNYFSKPWLDFTGRTMEQEVGLGWTQGVHPDDVKGCFDCFLPAFHARKPFKMEYRLKRTDGEYRWVIESGVPRYTGGGEFAGYIGSNIDITDRRRAEGCLAAEKRILELVAKGYPLPGILNSLCQMAEEQATGVLASILLVEDDRLRHGAGPSLPQTYMDAIDGAAIGPSAGSCGTAAYRGHQIIVEDIATDPLWANYRELALAHGLRACWSTPVFSSEHKVIATFAVYYREPRRPSPHDQAVIEQVIHLAEVTFERKLAQDALRTSEAYLAEAQRVAHVGTWVWKVQGREAVYLSDEWYRIYGFDPEDGAPTWEQRLGRVHPDDREKWEDVIDEAVRNRTDYELEFRVLLSTGMVRYIHTVGHPVTGPSGDLIKFVGASTDITERKNAEEERERLYRLEADLARINRVSMMGELAASLAHEIKQPISAAALDAGTCMEWLGRDQPDIAEARQAASRTIHDVKRASDIIARVRSLFNKGERQRELIDVNETIREMVGLLRSEAGRQAISIQAELANDLPSIWADRVQLQQVFMNLALNAIDAIKASNTPGSLKIKTQSDPKRGVLISVSDSGVGLPSDQKDQIFDAFFTTKSQGTGMGLSISRSIVESHGGRLWATANPGRGATFQFTLPCDAKAA